MKIGILGTAFSFHKAPFTDPSWELWACNLGEPPRWDVWFQLHSEAVVDANPGHLDWLKAQTKPVYMQKAYADIPASVCYPLEDMKAKYGDWFFTSSIAYMMALAIEKKPDEIGLWGVDMAADSEYAHQKPGVRFFIQVARMAGIRVTIPEECELAVPGRLYCYDGPSWLGMKLSSRQDELRSRMAQVEANRTAAFLKQSALMGARDIKLSPDQIAAELEKVRGELAQIERDALVFDGALQENAHLLTNWTGEQR